MPAIACANGPGSPDCSASTEVVCVNIAQRLGRMLRLAAAEHRRQDLVDDAGAMLGAGRWKIRPHLAQTDDAVVVRRPSRTRRGDRPCGRTRSPPAPRADSDSRTPRCCGRQSSAMSCDHPRFGPLRPARAEVLLYGHPIHSMTSPPDQHRLTQGGDGLQRRARRFLLGLTPWVGAIALWYAVRWSGFVNPSLIPAPHRGRGQDSSSCCCTKACCGTSMLDAARAHRRRARHRRRRAGRLPARLVSQRRAPSSIR